MHIDVVLLPALPAPHRQSQNASGPRTSHSVAEFYHNSRLHHLSTWKAELTGYVNALQGEGDEVTAAARSRLRRVAVGGASRVSPDPSLHPSRVSPHPSPDPSQRVIMHVDMDSFFVTVGLRKHPHLKGITNASWLEKNQHFTSSFSMCETILY